MAHTLIKINENVKQKKVLFMRKVRSLFKSHATNHAMKALDKSIVDLKANTEKCLNAYINVMKVSEIQEWIGGFRSRLIYVVDDVVKRHVKKNENKVL